MTGERTPAPAPSPSAGRVVRSLGALVAAAALVSGWWFVRNRQLYGELLGEAAFREKFRTAMSADSAAAIFNYRSRGALLVGLVLPTTFQTFWGAFGHLTPTPRWPGGGFMGVLPRETQRAIQDVPDWSRPLLSVVTLGAWPSQGYPPASWLYPLLALWTWAALGGAVRLYRRTRADLDPVSLRIGLALTGYSLLVFAAFLRFNTEYFQAQGRYLFPALGPIAMAFSAGWLAWFPERRRRWAAAGLLGTMALLAAYGLWGVIWPNFHGVESGTGAAV